MPSLADARPVRSMTGYASVRRATSAGEMTISLRSVNHRGLDLHFHQNNELCLFENAMRAALKQHLCRGHVEVRLSLLHADDAGPASYDAELIARYLTSFRAAAAEHNLSQEPDLNVAFGMPGAFERLRESESLDDALEPEVLAALHDCLADLNIHREREGAQLVSEFLREADAIHHAAVEIEAIRKAATHQFHQRLKERLSELLGQSGISEARLTEEAAILADRSDIQEELTRLNIHVIELRRILSQGGEVGKRLDFLLQEMNRETNTILSKTSGIGDTGLTVTKRALAIKAHIEKIREQVLNIE